MANGNSHSRTVLNTIVAIITIVGFAGAGFGTFYSLKNDNIDNKRSIEKLDDLVTEIHNHLSDSNDQLISLAPAVALEELRFDIDSFKQDPSIVGIRPGILVAGDAIYIEPSSRSEKRVRCPTDDSVPISASWHASSEDIMIRTSWRTDQDWSFLIANTGSTMTTVSLAVVCLY